MPLKILADENIDNRIIQSLRLQGIEVRSVREDFKGASDEEVLTLTRNDQALLLTEDKDFGEWVFAFKEKNIGVILLRYKSQEFDQIMKSLLEVFRTYSSSLPDKFVVVTPRKIRIRTI